MSFAAVPCVIPHDQQNHSHYRIDNTPRVPLTPSEYSALVRAYQQSVHMLGGPVTHNDATDVETRNLALLVKICERVQLPLAARTFGTMLSEVAHRYAAAHPISNRGTASVHAVPPYLSDNAAEPMMSLDTVIDAIERLKALHRLWLGAVWQRAGTGASRKEMVADDILDALQCIEASYDEPPSRPPDVINIDRHRHPVSYPRISLRSVVTALAGYSLMDPLPAGGSTTDAHDVFLSQQELAGSLLLRDVLSPDVGDESDDIKEAHTCWSGMPSRNCKRLPLADRTPATGNDGSLFNLNAFAHLRERTPEDDRRTSTAVLGDGHAASPQATATGSGVASGTEIPPRHVLDTTPRQLPSVDTEGADTIRASLELHLRGTPPAGGAARTLPTPSSNGRVSAAVAVGDALASSAPHDANIFLLRDVDVPRCPRALWSADDVDSDADVSQHGTARKGHRRSSTWGLMSSRASARSPSVFRVLPSPGSRSGLATPHPVTTVTATRAVSPPVVSRPSTEGRGACAAHERNNAPSIRSAALRSLCARPGISVASHQALQQPEYLRYRQTVQGLRVRQFR